MKAARRAQLRKLRGCGSGIQVHPMPKATFRLLGVAELYTDCCGLRQPRARFGASKNYLMLRSVSAALLLLSLLQGCPGSESSSPVRLKYTAAGKSPEVLATYEAWFGHPRHISVGYSSHDPSGHTQAD